MNKQLNNPKGFGEILDHTFQLGKNNFANFLKIFLILVGPIYLLEAIVQLIFGTSFFREVGSGTGWFEQIISGFEEQEAVTTNLAVDLWIILLGLISLLLLPIAQAAIFFAVDHIRKGEEYTVGSVIGKGFSRFWPILWSNILFFIIIVAIIFVPIIIVSIVGAIGIAINLIVGIILIFILGIGAFLGLGLLITRLSFYFGSVVLDKQAPGLGESWKISRNRSWALFGLYIVFSLIIGSINFAVEGSFGLFLGNSVLFSLISNFALLFTSMIFAVGYAVMFLDLKTRHSADDLKEMLSDYETPNND